MSEKNDYQTFKDNVMHPNDRCERIENRLFAGMPDVNCCISSVDCWLELKSGNEPVRPTSKFFADNHKLSIAQKNWHLSQKNAGGRSWILISTDKKWILINARHADELDNCTVKELEGFARMIIYKPVKDKNLWQVLRHVLIRS